jgi:hypothetical protein
MNDIDIMAGTVQASGDWSLEDDPVVLRMDDGSGTALLRTSHEQATS